ncbi:MAG TPA: DUF2505 domain-containing protein [Candidatus Corynebacterium avicola]|uniref:DUF2505 domain-containing protein n=1 Tax=Candidatus Corynebacterium avicola TaxID=2838527 RepID=A0A9D1UJS8_9CORY|nr:DUF2505 domain-containing protein [Candidatus Corynebacterium avicola]
MARSVSCTRSVDLPVTQVRDVVTSEAYLLTVDQSSDGSGDGAANLVVDSGERTVEPDGAVNATVVATQQAGTSGEGKSTPAMSVEQTTVVTPFLGDRFTVSSVTSLPKGMGSMTMVLEYRGGQDAATAVDATVTADVKIPLLGRKIAAKLLEKAEDSVDKAVGKVERLADGKSG